MTMQVARAAPDADRLLREVTDDPLGDVSVSVYDTARLVALAPWLDGHAPRLRFLCDHSSLDGGWGDPAYGLVATLSVTEALLASLARHEAPGDGPARDEVVRAAVRGLGSLAGGLVGPASRRVVLPDTVAVELLVPALVARIDEHLDRHQVTRGYDLPEWCARLRLEPPPGCATGELRELQQAAAAGRPLPQRLWYSWEALAPIASRSPQVRPVGGAVCASPAATAAWLGRPDDPADPSAEYLRRLPSRQGGPVQGTAPIDFFEAAWVLGLLATHGVPHARPQVLLARLRNGLSTEGIPTGTSLPPDGDATSAALYALALHGDGWRPDCLLGFFQDDHFCTFPGERTPSVSANAHALDALGLIVARHPEDGRRYGGVIDKVTEWLLAQQHDDGSWTDKWHASPYYATVCSTQALAAWGGTRSRPALARAAAWTLASQRSPGGWGRWAVTQEETAYAVWTLLAHHGDRPTAAIRDALVAAESTLQASDHGADPLPLWHGKDLYAPRRVIRATRLAGLHTLRQAGLQGAIR